MVGSGGRNEQHARDISREVITLKTKTFDFGNVDSAELVQDPIALWDFVLEVLVPSQHQF
jgi:hypothetical protein